VQNIIYEKYQHVVCLALTRYIDNVFVTINLLPDQMIVEVEKAKQRDSNIGITYSIPMATDFLDVGIENHRIP
jgi:hypothetical protein